MDIQMRREDEANCYQAIMEKINMMIHMAIGFAKLRK